MSSHPKRKPHNARSAIAAEHTELDCSAVFDFVVCLNWHLQFAHQTHFLKYISSICVSQENLFDLNIPAADLQDIQNALQTFTNKLGRI